MCKSLSLETDNLFKDAPPPLPPKRRTTVHSVPSWTEELAQTSSTRPTQDKDLLSVSGHDGQSTSPLQTTPRSQSPSSSGSSAFSASSEDILTSPSKAILRHQRLSHYDNFSSSDPSNFQINDLTQKIKELTSSVDVYHKQTTNGLTNQKGVHQNGDTPPLLPEKTNIRRSLDRIERSRVHSQYDNLSFGKPDGVTDFSNILRTSHSAVGMSSSSARTSSAMYTKTTKVSLSQETFSSSETFSSTGTYSSSMESLQKPPPLPPKKHGEYEMKVWLPTDNPFFQNWLPWTKCW